jgi:hypothetical protein
MKSSIGALLALALITGCNTGNQPARSESKQAAATPATEAELGRAAFQKTYIAARGWASDAMPYNEYSQPTSEVPGEGGKSAVWTAGFGSAAKGLAKTFTWSGTNAPDAPARGITPSAEDTFNPRNISTRTFDLGFLKVESDQAFQIAQQHGGKKLTEKNSNIPVTYRLGWSGRDNQLQWHVIYGDNQLSVAINATTGQFVRIEK